MTEIETATTAMADIKDTLEFCLEHLTIVIFIGLPSDRMSYWSSKTALTIIGSFAHGKMQAFDMISGT